VEQVDREFDASISLIQELGLTEEREEIMLSFSSVPLNDDWLRVDRVASELISSFFCRDGLLQIHLDFSSTSSALEYGFL
jgi:hypothetical protein